MTGGFARARLALAGLRWRIFAALALVAAVAGCGSSSHHALPRPQPTRVTAPVTSTTTTTPGPQTSGPRTVLSPIGLRVRAQPSRSAAVLGTAAQGTVLNVSSHTPQGGGWFQVKGATVTGWISDDPTLSASGRFAVYNSNPEFAVLYPAAWTVTETPPTAGSLPNRAIFHAPSGPQTVALTTAANVAQLGKGQAGYDQTGSQQVVVCGVTSSLFVYSQTGSVTATNPTAGGVTSGLYLAQVRLTIDAQHALGIDATMTDLSQLGTVSDFVNSVTFSSPQCQH